MTVDLRLPRTDQITFRRVGREHAAGPPSRQHLGVAFGCSFAAAAALRGVSGSALPVVRWRSMCLTTMPLSLMMS